MPVARSENVTLDGPKPRQLADLVGIQRDLLWVSKAFQVLSHREDRHQFPVLHLEALHDAGLVRYARCFKKGRRNAFHIPKAWIDTLAAHLVEMHNRAMDIRDKHVAHSINDWEVNVPVVQVVTAGGGTTVRGVSVQHHRVVMLGRRDISFMHSLAEALLERVSAFGKDLEREIRRELDGLSPREIRRRAPPVPELARRNPGKDRRS